MQRPLFKDYAKQFLGSVFLIRPIISQNRSYNFAHRTMLMLFQIPFFVAILFLYNYSPFSMSYATAWPKWIAALIGLLLLAAYWLFFVYRFACFNVEPEDMPLHPDEAAAEEQHSAGNMLDTPQNSRNAWKSRGIFALLAVALAGITIAYCVLGFGLAPWRLYYNHTEALNQLVDIAHDYEYLDIYPAEKSYVVEEKNDPIQAPHDLSDNTYNEVQALINSMHNLYIDSIYYSDNELQISLYAEWGYHYSLEWHPDEMAVETVQEMHEGTCCMNIQASQLDAHWWMVWYTLDCE